MPNWNSLLDEIKQSGSTFDIVRRRYLNELSSITGRNTIVYYSGWLQKGVQIPNFRGFAVNDNDKNGFMTAIHELDRSKGLDLILHTPGGETAATESLVDYLRSMFGTNIRAIIPQLAMSAGTMIALSCKEIIMGKHSSLGPIDPQLFGLPAHGVIEEFQRAATDIANNPAMTVLWQPIIAKYNPTLIGECEKAIIWSKEMVTEWLISGMFVNHENSKQDAEQVVNELSSHILTKSHARHISADKARSLGINIIDLESDQKLQEAIMSVHHSCIITLSSTPAYKIIENQNGTAFIEQLEPMYQPNPQV